MISPQICLWSFGSLISGWGWGFWARDKFRGQIVTDSLQHLRSLQAVQQ